MQCANCQFENMPGSKNCARCGSSMALATETIDVHPPRAKRWSKPIRSVSRGRYAVSNRMSAAFARMEAVRFEGRSGGPPLTLALLVHLIAPGWAQFYLSRPVRGYIFSCGAAVAALLAILFVGTTLGSVSLGMLFSLHAGSISDAIMPPGSAIGASIGGGLLVYVALGLLIYLPAISLIGRVVRPYTIHRDIAPFREDDVILVRPQRVFARGEAVLYTRNGGRVEIAPRGNERTYLELDGVAIDRILAGPGDHIQSTKDGILVNGLPVRYHPLNSTTIPPLDMTVPAHCYFIWPSVAYQLAGAGSLSGVAIVDESAITGAVVFQSSPWSRAGFIR